MGQFTPIVSFRAGVASGLVACALIVTPAARAAIVNRGFETGNLTGWQSTGPVSVVTDTFGSGPTEGTYEALLTNGTGSVSDSALESFMGVPAGTLDGLGNGNATVGSAIKQTFPAGAGNVVSFDWNFFTNEFTPQPTFNDFAFVTISGVTSTLANTHATFMLSSTQFSQETGFHSFTYNIPASGTYTIAVGVVDVGDTGVDSALLIDNFSDFSSTCGDGVLDFGEQCDDGNVTPGDGCDDVCQVESCYTCAGEPSTCSPSPDGSDCDDGVFCDGMDTCSGGACTAHTGDPCTGGVECSNVCNEANSTCNAPSGTSCTDDGNACTQDQCDGMGACVHSNDDFASCNDGVFCNGSDFCEFGSCVLHDGDPCEFNECASTCDEMTQMCDPDMAGQPCSDDGEVCTEDQCDGMGSCAHPPAPAGIPCPDDGLVCTNDQCDGQGFCAHPPLPGGAPCPDDGNTCTNDECNGIGLCVHPALADGTACDDANACTQTDRCQSGHCVGSDPVICTAPACHQVGMCDPSTGTCTDCPAGYTPGEGGCQKTYAIAASMLDNQFLFCDDATRYNGCGTQPFGFHWTDAGDAGVGEVMRVDVQLETGIDCTNTEHDVTLNSTSIGVYASTAGCFCAPAPSPKLLTDVDTSTYVKGGPNSVSIDSFGCAGLSEDEQGDFALVTTTYEDLGAPIAIRTGCRQAAKSTFKYYNRATDARDKVLWRWRRGAATTQVEFADPTASADYQFCIYVETTGAPALLIGAEVPAGASLWRAVRNVGYQYTDKTASHDGIRQILVKGGTAGRSKIVLRGKGTALSDPTLPRSPATDIRVQLTNASTGICWESEFPVSDLTGSLGGKSP